MKITLRDIFWLVLLVAIGISWYVEDSQIVGAFATFCGNSSRQHHAAEQALPATDSEVISSLQKLSDEELVAALPHVKEFHANNLYLQEMSRRRMSKQLRQIYEGAKQIISNDPNLPPNSTRRTWDNRGLLTLLRRAEGKPDPIRVEILSIQKDLQGNRTEDPLIIPRVTNVDVEQEPFFIEGSYYASEFWQIQLTSAAGEIMPRNHWVPADYGGTSISGMLPYGQSESPNTVLNARAYFRQPPPGRYTLQLLFSDGFIAGQVLPSGVIWKSALVPVIVDDHSLPSKWYSLRLPLIIVAAALLLVCVAIVRRWFSRRDFIALAVIAVLAASWGGHTFWLKRRFEQQGLKPHAIWTMRLAE